MESQAFRKSYLTGDGRYALCSMPILVNTRVDLDIIMTVCSLRWNCHRSQKNVYESKSVWITHNSLLNFMHN